MTGSPSGGSRTDTSKDIPSFSSQNKSGNNFSVMGVRKMLLRKKTGKLKKKKNPKMNLKRTIKNIK